MQIDTEIWDHHVIGPVMTNCFIFGDKTEATLVDPGGPEAISIAKKLLENEIELKHILVTHGHFDHLGWAPEVQKIAENAKVYLHEAEKPAYEPFLDRMPKLLGMKPFEIREPDVWIKTDQIIEVSKLKFKVLHTPGHSPGSVVFQLIDGLHAFVGDLIFQGSIGRVDLPFSNPEDMKKSLKLIMTEIEANTDLYPGHGNLTNMQIELSNNPYLMAIRNNIAVF